MCTSEPYIVVHSLAQLHMPLYNIYLQLYVQYLFTRTFCFMSGMYQPISCWTISYVMTVVLQHVTKYGYDSHNLSPLMQGGADPCMFGAVSACQLTSIIAQTHWLQLSVRDASVTTQPSGSRVHDSTYGPAWV